MMMMSTSDEGPFDFVVMTFKSSEQRTFWPLLNKATKAMSDQRKQRKLLVILTSVVIHHLLLCLISIFNVGLRKLAGHREVRSPVCRMLEPFSRRNDSEIA